MRDIGFGLPLSFLLALQVSEPGSDARSRAAQDILVASVDEGPDALTKERSQGADAQSRTKVAQYSCVYGYWRRC